MSEETLSFPITECPKCGDPHDYKIEVKRGEVLYQMTNRVFEERPKKVKKRLRLTCKNTDEPFMVNITLEEDSFRPIESVRPKEG